MVLIGELVKALNLYSNPGVGHHSNVNNNSNARIASKRFWIESSKTCINTPERLDSKITT